MPDDPGPSAWQQLPSLGGPNPPVPPGRRTPSLGAPGLRPGRSAGAGALAPDAVVMPSAAPPPGTRPSHRGRRRGPGGSGDGHVAGPVRGSAGGAATPAGAVSDLFTALGNSDVIGMLDSVAPGERDAIEPGLEDIFGQFKRLGILSTGPTWAM